MSSLSNSLSPLDTLLWLLSSALGQKNDRPLPIDSDWQAVIDLAMSHGLDAVAFDGLEDVYAQQPERADELDAALGEKKYEWMGYVMQVEQDNEAYLGKLRKLTAFLHDEGFKVLVMKGYGLSLDWPVPAHRPTGDIDIYLYGQGEKADQRLKEEWGVKIKQNQDMHSNFPYGKTLVENHATFLNIIGHPSLAGIERFLEQEALTAPMVNLDGIPIHIPTPRMNAVYLPLHMAGHFVFAGMNLRQWFDWAVFVSRHGASLDWKEVRERMEEAGSLRFLQAINGLLVKHLSIPSACLPDWERDPALEDRIWQEILHPRDPHAKRSVWRKLRDFFEAGWRFRIVYRETFLPYFFRRGWASFRVRRLPHSRSVWKTNRQSN